MKVGKFLSTILLAALCGTSLAQNNARNDAMGGSTLLKLEKYDVLSVASKAMEVTPSLCSAQSACGGSANHLCPNSSMRYFYQCSDGQDGCAPDPSCN